MYEIKLINENEETIINSISTSVEAPRLSSFNIKHGINVIDTLTFDISPNNPGYFKIIALKTLIEVLNKKLNKVEFRGRILLPTEKMNNNGVLTKSVVCESELGYLMDSSTTYGEYHNISVKNFLKVIIDNHNNQVSEDKKFVLGNVTVKNNNDRLYRYLGYVKTFQSIKDKLIDRLGGELQIRYENGTRYLDYLESIGEFKETEIRISKNLKSIEQQKDPTSIISRLIPLGSKLENSEERLTIESVNGGIKYIDDIDAMKKFGVIVGVKLWDDVTRASNLLKNGQDYLKRNNKIKKKYKITALDLSLIGLDLNSFEVYNTYNVINPLMNINEELRVIEKNIDGNNPQNSSLTVGDKFEDIKQYQLGIIKANKNIETLNENINSTIDVVKTISTESKNTAKVLNKTNEVLTNTNQTVKDLTDAIIEINNRLNDNVKETQNLINATSDIKDNFNNVNNKLEKLKRRAIMEV
ncbi:phage tail spike protein [Clostridium septicum]|uniref:Lysin n=1 Tax=Clostridium septicum TaxID=1504 RepID=A0A9N7JN11_CLOSE|nr:phage tail spike protein [Clostridium septicum]AYE35320.1 lysin [Clostridium septicum]QAS60708.1 lysin [Clostridium septicum]UEC20024.1 phage tail protein [Clostridium septicum]USS01919.1 phage tail protein [Clostridium septicum]